MRFHTEASSFTFCKSKISWMKWIRRLRFWCLFWENHWWYFFVPNLLSTEIHEIKYDEEKKSTSFVPTCCSLFRLLLLFFFYPCFCFCCCCYPCYPIINSKISTVEGESLSSEYPQGTWIVQQLGCPKINTQKSKQDFYYYYLIFILPRNNKWDKLIEHLGCKVQSKDI